MIPNTLTTQEARAIVRHKGYGGNVTDSLNALALITLEANAPIITYESVNWYEDDGSDIDFERAQEEWAENLQEDERRDAAFRNGGR